MNLLEFISDERNLTTKTVELIPILARYPLVFLKGEMGSGKTSLVRTIGDILGFKHEVSSPTFSIINEYHAVSNNWGIQQVYHMDLYRLKTLQEALDIGILEYLDGPGLCIIEWPEMLQDLLQNEAHLDIQIEVLENQQRKYTLTV